MLEIEARYNLRATDGGVISVLNRGITVRSLENVYVRTRIEFATGATPHDWLNRTLFIGTVQLIGRDPLTVLVSAFKVI